MMRMTSSAAPQLRSTMLHLACTIVHVLPTFRACFEQQLAHLPLVISEDWRCSLLTNVRAGSNMLNWIVRRRARTVKNQGSQLNN